MPSNDTNSNIVAGSQDFSESQENLKSYLWTRDTFALCNLLEKGGFYHQPGTKEALLTLNPSDEHIIIQEISASECWVKESDECYIRGTAYALRAKGVPFSKIQVLAIGGSLLEYTQDAEKVKQIGLMLLPVESLVAPRPFTDWEDDLTYELSPREAAQIAQLIIAVLEPCDRVQATIALENLRRRTGMNEYTWNKKYLAQIRGRLERCLTKSDILSKIDRLIEEGVSGSRLTGQLNRLAAESQYAPSELRRLYHERLSETDIEIERRSNRSQVTDLLQKTNIQIDLADYLPEALATPITQWCKWLNIRPAVVLTALLASASSLHKTGTEIVLKQNWNFRVLPTIFAALVSPSGQKKTPILNNIVRQPLNRLKQDKTAAHEAAMADYETAMQQWEQTKQGEKPKEPKDPTLYYFTSATGEAIPVQAQKDPDKALLGLIDELSGYFNSTNAYRRGRGSDKQDLLSYFDGSGQTVLRASGVKVNLSQIYLSIFGTIQPEILKQHMEDCSDPDGNWARFLFAVQPLQAAVMDSDDEVTVQISDRIYEFYRRIDRLPKMEYHLSREAFKRYQGVYDQLERLRVTNAHSGMAAVYSKMEGYIGRLALNLHVLWELAAGKDCPSAEIPLHIMEMAIQLSRFYMGQVKVIHANSDDDSLPSHILKMIELSKRLEANGKSGWIKAQQIRELFAKKKRPLAQTARDWMNEAVKMGYGQTRNSGNRLQYHWRNDPGNPSSDPPPNLGNLEQHREDLGNTIPDAETTEYQGVEDNLGNLGNTSPNDPPTSKEEHGDTDNHGDDLGQSSLEGGESAEPTLSEQQDAQNPDEESVSELRDERREQFPNHSLSSLNEAVEDAIAPTPTPLENPRELHGWDELHSARPYPNPKSNSINTRRQRALKIREAIRAAGTKEDLSALRCENGGDFSVDELLWVLALAQELFPG